jgi:drug/metabolite transporter (DMT)-like permease
MASLRSDIFFALSNSEHYPLKSCCAAGGAIGVLSGWLLLGEVIQNYVYIGGLCIFLGIFLVNWSGRKNQKKTSSI